MNEQNIYDEMILTNIALYKAIFHIEHLLRKMCYASYISVSNENWQKKIPKKISDNISIRRKLNKPYSYLTKQYFSHPMWGITLFELLEMLTEPEDVWVYFKKKTKTEKHIFISKTRELEYVRNVISHGNNVGPETVGSFISLVEYFNTIINSFKGNMGIVSDKNGNIIFSYEEQEKFVLRHENEEDVFSYKIYKKLKSTFSQKQIPVNVLFLESGTEIIVSIVSPSGVPVVDVLLRGLVDNTLINYLIAIAIEGEPEHLSIPRKVRFILSANIRKNDCSQDLFIKYVINSLVILCNRELFVADPDNLTDKEIDMIKQTLSNENKNAYCMRKQLFYHPLIWDEVRDKAEENPISVLHRFIS